jgi:hypothetical protein
VAIVAVAVKLNQPNPQSEIPMEADLDELLEQVFEIGYQEGLASHTGAVKLRLKTSHFKTALIEWSDKRLLKIRENIIQADLHEVEAKTKDWREGYRRGIHIAISEIDSRNKLSKGDKHGN